MTTDKDILAAIRGEQPTATKRAEEDIRSAFRGGLSSEQRAYNDAIGEAFGRKVEREPAPGELPLNRRGDAFEGAVIWAAKEATKVATQELAEAIMRADGGKNIYMAEAEAKEIAAEAYTNAAKASRHEDVRQKAAERAIRSITASITRQPLREARRPKPAPVSSTGTTTITSGRKTSEATTLAGCRRMQISETGRTGHITNL